MVYGHSIIKMKQEQYKAETMNRNRNKQRISRIQTEEIKVHMSKRGLLRKMVMLPGLIVASRCQENREKKTRGIQSFKQDRKIKSNFSQKSQGHALVSGRLQASKNRVVNNAEK